MHINVIFYINVFFKLFWMMQIYKKQKNKLKKRCLIIKKNHSV